MAESSLDTVSFRGELPLVVMGWMTIKIMMMTLATMIVVITMLIVLTMMKTPGHADYMSVGQRDMGGAKDGRRVRKASDKWTGPFSK